VGSAIPLAARCAECTNGPLQYAWTVERRPTGSVARIGDPFRAEASFVPDRPTTELEPYVFRVTATNVHGASGSCQIVGRVVVADGG
jgi:hypothetical protein